jgi:hypothetical protein
MILPRSVIETGMLVHPPVESLQKRLDLILDRIVQAVRYDEFHVFCLVLLGHRYGCPADLQLDSLLFAKLVVFNSELLLRQSQT